MPCIHILQPDLRNKIAAGEVIERPMSVVKELMENSIDAGSRNIRIEILSGGKHLIGVSDDGTGMDREDVALAFQRHATSKLLKDADLFNITTLGFRGEALPAIASVAKVELLTGTKDSPFGTSLEIDGGQTGEMKDAPPVNGTTVKVRDLFYNTPARKKFLKSNRAELYHIIDAVTRAALSNWGIGIRLTTDRHETMNLPAASGARERLIQIFGNEFLSELSEIQSDAGDMKIHAFISSPRNFRNSRGNQYIFVNGRPVKDASISHAVYAAFEGILPQERHPMYFVFLDIAPFRVDFNVHPAKREVRFADRETVYRFVLTALRKAIKDDRTEYTKKFIESSAAETLGQHPGTLPSPYPTSHALHAPMVTDNLELSYTPSIPFIYLGGTFIALSGKGGLTIIDHHAAHERILFEKLLKGMEAVGIRLLFPQQIRLSVNEYGILLQHRDILQEFGIEVEDFGQNTVIVRSLPEELFNADMKGVLSDLSSALIEGTASRKSLQENLAARIACHSSIRGKDILSREELAHLIDELEKTDNPDQCPHGRPTRIFYSLDDLNKLFKRK